MKRKSQYRARLDDFERKVDQARVQYENYFSVADGREPTWLRNEINKEMKFFRRCAFTSPVDRNRFSTLASRCSILTRRWDLIKREQEEGQIRKRHMRGRELEELDAPEELAPSDASVSAELPEREQSTPECHRVRQVTASSTPQEVTPEAPRGALDDLPGNWSQVTTAPQPIGSHGAFGAPLIIPPGGFVAEEARPLFAVYLEAVRQSGALDQALSWQAFVETIGRQLPQLEQRGYERIQFQVFLKDGVARLRPMGKKTP